MLPDEATSQRRLESGAFPKGHEVVIGEKLHHVVPELLSVAVLKIVLKPLGFAAVEPGTRVAGVGRWG